MCIRDSRVTKEEALDLPEQTFENRYITLSRSERNLYDRLRRDSYAELADGGTITATTVLTKLLRLQQFTGGFLVEDDAIQPKLVSRGKLDALEAVSYTHLDVYKRQEAHGELPRFPGLEWHHH